ncbi:hypothetical protein M2251_003113 [Rhodococcus erythropolis]|nr:hypothetical protein [Rhodococcus erythropolis]
MFRVSQTVRAGSVPDSTIVPEMPTGSAGIWVVGQQNRTSTTSASAVWRSVVHQGPEIVWPASVRAIRRVARGDSTCSSSRLRISCCSPTSVEPAWNDGARCSRVQVSRSTRTLAPRQHLVVRVRQRHVLGVVR